MNYYPTTHWSLVVQAGKSDDGRSTEAMAELCRLYWYPVYALARSLGDSHEDAEDHTQAFLLHITRTRFAARANPLAGKFRTFLAVAFRNFRSAELRRGRTIKRGGQVQFVPLDLLDAEGRYALETQMVMSPETRFDRNWAKIVLTKARAMIESEYAAAQKQALYLRLLPFLSASEDGSGYGSIAEEFDKTVDAIKMELSRLRRRYRELLKAVVGGTVLDPTMVDDELRYLLQILAEQPGV